jgi:hypothetical protein
MDALIRRSEGKKFSGEDIARLCENKVVIRRCRDLANMRSIKEAMGKNRAMIILYETKEASGHWCAVFEAAPGIIEFFDPYGIAPDGELDFIEKGYRRASGQGRHLSRLLESAGRSGYNMVVYNNEPLQKLARDMNTCGRWCGLRVSLKRMPLKKFIGLFRKQKFPADWYVTALTLFV